jgi:hypothetical protein
MGTSAVQRNRNKAREMKTGRENESRGEEALDSSLRLIFDSLAQLLVANGYGFARLGKLAKISFVNAAKSIDEEQGRRISKARIAALTGLTRTEVSKLLRGGEQDLSRTIDSENRTLRVVQGWLTDAKFLRPDNSPRRLQFKGSNSSFSYLVKKYSGDIPARAMLTEMKRLRIVRHDAQDCVVLVKTRLSVPRRTMLAMRAISPWVEMLTGDSANRLGEVTSRIKQVNLTFGSLPQLLAAVRELEHRRAAFINNLQQLGNETSAIPKHSLRISIAVAAQKAILRTKHR